MKKIFLTILVIAFGFTTSNAQTSMQKPNGKGTVAEPYEIASLANLSWLTQQSVGAWRMVYVQTANIDASETVNWDDTDDNGDEDLFNDPNDLTSDGNNEGWLPIREFKDASYNGNGNTIDMLTINRTTNYAKYAIGGMFDTLKSSRISNLGLTNLNITGITYVGGLGGVCLGDTEDSLIVDNCYTTGTITASGNRIGGLIAYMTGGLNRIFVKNSYSAVDVSSTGRYVGGFIGNPKGIKILVVKECYSTGNASANGSVGAFIGKLEEGGSTVSMEITECYSRGNVVSTGDYGGGFVGYIKEDKIAISNCYSFGNVSGSGSKSGGFIGYNKKGSIENCYSVGTASKGFVGKHSAPATYTNCFFDAEASGGTDSKATAKTTAEMQTQATFTGWDFTNIWEIVEVPSAGLAKVNANNYPRLRNQQDGALPVELTAFTASVNGSSVELLWATATEVNNFGFAVERKLGDDNWSELGFVKGSGNSNSPKNYSYSDANGIAGKYFYRLKQMDIDGTYEYSQAVEATIGVPDKFEVMQNYPNPFNPTTVISFSLPSTGNVKISVYNAIGEIVATLLNEELNAGVHKVNFNGSNLSTGIYFYEVKTSGFSKTMKMLLIK